MAEKLTAMRTAAFFAERRGRGDRALFRQLLTRPGGIAPAAEDQVPEAVDGSAGRSG